jgi:hypothetical protein
VMIINDDSRVISKLEASLTGEARVVIYDHHMFILQATGCYQAAQGAKVSTASYAVTSVLSF